MVLIKESWKKNEVYERVRDIGQKSISTRWIVTDKVVKGEVICKARLVARGFEEKGKDLNTDQKHLKCM